MSLHLEIELEESRSGCGDDQPDLCRRGNDEILGEKRMAHINRKDYDEEEGAQGIFMNMKTYVSSGHASVAAVSNRDQEGESVGIWRTVISAYQTLGVVFGGLATSPLYVYPSMNLKSPDEEDYLGILSLMFWTLSMIGVVKYVCIALRADDRGEDMGIERPVGWFLHQRQSEDGVAEEGEPPVVMDRLRRRLEALTRFFPMVAVEDLPPRLQMAVIGLPRPFVHLLCRVANAVMAFEAHRDDDI